MTHNAVRAHLATLQRDGLVREAGMQRGQTRPAVMYELVPQASLLFSRAYVPFLTQLLRVLRERTTEGELDALMRTVGSALAAESLPLRESSGSAWMPRRVCSTSLARSRMWRVCSHSS